ncbi:MAG TPA: type IV secretion system protein [Candidatus Tectomicrobia bacterium]
MDFLTTMLSTFQGVLSLGMYRTGSVMAGIFWVLTVIELVSFGGWWLYSHDTNAGAVVLRLVALMVFAWMIQHWQTIAGSMQDMFVQLGISLGGSKLTLPTVHGAGMAIIDKGYELSLAIQGRTVNPSFLDRLGETVDALAPTQAAMEKWILSWFAWAAFIVAGIGMFLVQLQFVLFSAIAFVTIPFAAWGRTAWITEKTFGSVMACGVEITFLYALAGMQLIVFEHWTTPPVITQRGSVSIIAGGWFLVALMLAAHKLAGGILHGVPSLTQSDVLPRLSTAVALSSKSMRAAATAMRQLSRRRP